MSELRVVATSRTALGLDTETVFPVPPLAAAGELFFDRVSTIAPAYAATESERGDIERICALTGGLPLAIELAASWITALSPGDIAARLREDAGLLDDRPGTLDDPHRRLTGVLRAVWASLSERLRQVLAAVSSFAGGFTREGAEAVIGATAIDLAGLVDRGLIQRLPHPAGTSRYIVHELVRRHALTWLDDDSVRRRHFDYLLGRTEQGERTDAPPDGSRWPHPLATEIANLQGACRWALERGDADRALQMSTALAGLPAYAVPSASVRHQLLGEALALPTPDERSATTRVRARALAQLAHLEFAYRGYHHTALDLFTRGGRLFGEVGDRVGVAECLRGRGLARAALGDLQGGRRDHHDSASLSAATGDRLGQAWSGHLFGHLALSSGDVSRAVRHFGDAVELFEVHGSGYAVFRALFDLAEAQRRRGDRLSTARSIWRAIDRYAVEPFAVGVCDVLDVLGLLGTDLHRNPEAAELLGAAEHWRAAHEEVTDVFLAPVLRAGRRCDCGWPRKTGARRRPAARICIRTGSSVVPTRSSFVGRAN